MAKSILSDHLSLLIRPSLVSLRSFYITMRLRILVISILLCMSALRLSCSFPIDSSFSPSTIPFQQSIRPLRFRGNIKTGRWSHSPHFSLRIRTGCRMRQWEGDDLRWSRRLRRRLQRRQGPGEDAPAKNALMVMNILFFLYQTIITVDFIRRAHPEYWPRQALPIIGDVLWGNSVRGPLTLDFAFSNSLSHSQPHRFVTSGLIHGGILHLLVNLDTMRRQPPWLEGGLGKSLYLTTYFAGIVMGNLGHVFVTKNPYNRTLLLGASGGICGLYGLMFAALVKMGNSKAALLIAKGMAILLASGMFFESVSNATHFGGFFGGLMLGMFCAPNYRKSYVMRRKNSIEYDPYSRDYRRVMGFGITPSERGLIPIALLWATLATVFAISSPKIRSVPSMILKGLLNPGSLISSLAS